jgi:hypothetical protein
MKLFKIRGVRLLLVIPAFFVDRSVARHRTPEAKLQAEQLRVLRVTMRTVQDIVNNNLNQLQLLRLQAEGHVPKATLTLFDDALQDTAARLSALANMEAFAEKPMGGASGLDVSAPSVPHGDPHDLGLHEGGGPGVT